MPAAARGRDWPLCCPSLPERAMLQHQCPYKNRLYRRLEPRISGAFPFAVNIIVFSGEFPFIYGGFGVVLKIARGRPPGLSRALYYSCRIFSGRLFRKRNEECASSCRHEPFPAAKRVNRQSHVPCLLKACVLRKRNVYAACIQQVSLSEGFLWHSGAFPDAGFAFGRFSLRRQDGADIRFRFRRDGILMHV